MTEENTHTMTQTAKDKVSSLLHKFRSNTESDEKFSSLSEEPDPQHMLTGNHAEENPQELKAELKEKQNEEFEQEEIVTAEQNEDLFKSNPDKFGIPGLPFDRKNPVRFGFLAATGALISFYLWHRLGSLSSIIIWFTTALFIALGLEPIVQWFMRKGLPRWTGVLTVTLTAVLLFAIFVANLVPTIISQITTLVNNVPQYVQTALNSSWFHNVDQQFGIRHVIEENTQKVVSEIGAKAGDITGLLVGAGSKLSSGFFGGFMILILTIYLLSSMPQFKAFIYRMIPASRRQRFQPLSEEVIRGVSGYVSGQATVALINASCACTIMYFLHMPYLVLLTFMVAILAFIPLVGATVALIFISLIASTISVKTAILWAVCYFIYLQIETYVIYPNVMKRAVEVPPAVSIVAVLVGSTLLGVLGAVMAIPVAAAVILIIREVVVPRQDKR
ncbi:MAG: AI-2E family transporter [Micrococcaceae bacterium]